MIPDISLEKLYAFTNTNKQYVQELTNYIKDNNVVPFVGAGMSIGIYPTWQQFFEDILKTEQVKPSDQSVIEQLLREKEFEKAASNYYRSVGKVIFYDTIKRTFSEEKISADKFRMMPIYLLPSIFKNSTVITTNFDRLIQEVYRDCSCSFRESYTPYESSNVAKGEIAQVRGHYLLKLHGDYISADMIVFTEEQYNTCYGESLDSEYIKFLSNVLSNRILLFLGCSLSTDRTIKLLEKISLTDDRIHYAILETPSDTLDDEYYDKKTALSNIGIKGIWYPKGKHSYVSLILKELKRKLSTAENYLKVHVITNTLVQNPSKDFLGREYEIESIEEDMEQGIKLVLVNGIGGIGKTQICSYMYHQYLEKTCGEITHLAWISYDGDLKRSIFQHFRDITEIDDSSDYFNKSIEYINNLGRKLLLFLDNANTITLAEQEILSNFTCRVIVTSRIKEFDDSFKKIEIEQLQEENCLTLYKINAYGDAKKVLNREELKAVKELIYRSDKHSMTLVLLAKTQRETHISAKKLMEQVIDSDFNLSNIKETIRYKNEEDIFIEHLKKLFQVVELKPEESKLLKWFSLMPNMPLPYDKVKQWFELDNFNYVNGLIKRGWLLENIGEAVWVHPIIAAVIRAEYGIDVEECERVIENITNEISYTSYDNYADKWIYLPFAAGLAKCFEKNYHENIKLSVLYLGIGSILQDQGDYEKALTYYEQALNIREIVLGKEHPSTATTYNNMALVFQDQRDYEKALTYYEQALHIKEKVLGREHPSTATTYNNMALVFQAQGDYEKALKYYEQALNIKKS